MHEEKISPTIGSTRPTVLVLALAFGSIALSLIISHGVFIVHSRDIQSGVDVIAENSLASIRIVERMGIDIERQRALVVRHILEADDMNLDAIESKLAAIHEDYLRQAKAYDLLAIFPGEAVAWKRLRDDVEAADLATAEALTYSREKHHEQARKILVSLESVYNTIENDVDDLVTINQQEGERALNSVRNVQEEVMLVRGLLVLFAVGITLIVGIWTTRRILQRESEIRGHARELEHKNRELDAFAARVAHDLRGPLTIISLASSKSGDAMLMRGVRRMEDLIEDLLTLSRIGSEGADVVAHVDQVTTSVQGDIKQLMSGTDATLKIDAEPCDVRCSEGLLRVLFWNLAENAVKYSRVGVPLQLNIQGRISGRSYELRVSDNGLGMPPNEVRQVFEPFFRGEQVRGTTSGTGLGLAIVKRIVEVSRGTVSVQSTVNSGTTFVIRLPVAY